MNILSKSTGFLRSRINISLLFNYLKASIVLLLILCIAVSVIYGLMNRSLRDQVNKVNDILLQNTMNALEKEFASLDELVSIINFNPKISKYMNMHYHDLSPIGHYRAYEIMKDLRTYVLGNEFIDEIDIFFDNDIIISNSYKADTDFYLEHLNKREKGIADLPKSYYYKSTLSLDHNGKSTSIYYINSLPIGNKRTQKATVIMHINPDIMFDLITSNQLTDKTETRILDYSKNHIISYNTGDNYLEKEDLVVNSIKSTDIPLEVVSITPRGEFDTKLTLLRSKIMYLMLLFLGLGMIFAVYFSYKNYHPMITLVEIIGQENMADVEENIFKHIEYNISKIIDENWDLRKTIDRQMEIINSSAIEKLLKQGVSDEEEIISLLEVSGISSSTSIFKVYTIKLDVSSEINIDYPSLIKEIEALINVNQKGHVLYINEYNISLLLQIKDESIFDPMRLGEQVIQVFQDNDIVSTVGIGQTYYDIKDVNKSYREALSALNVGASSLKGDVIPYEDIKSVSDNKPGYYYPIDVEQQIVNSTREGNIGKVKGILQDIYNKNFKEIQLSGQISRILVSNMVSTVIKIMNDLKIDLSNIERTNMLSQLYNAERVNDAYDSLIVIYTVICNLINKNKTTHNERLFVKIDDYLKSQYRNQQISLKHVAIEFDLSESYLSRFFKEQSGMNFNDYLHSLRIEEAKELLTAGDKMLVKEVALKVGYSNAGGLIRAFNRYVGVTPGEYRSRYVL